MKQATSPTLVILIATLVFSFSSNAHAYIDPGSGSALMSVIIGLLVAIGITIKTFWYKITSIFGFSKKKPQKKSPSEDTKMQGNSS